MKSIPASDISPGDTVTRGGTALLVESTRATPRGSTAGVLLECRVIRKDGTLGRQTWPWYPATASVEVLRAEPEVSA